MSTSKPGSAGAIETGDAARLFSALGDRTRFRLLVRLSEGGPASISGLSADSGVTRQAITKHLHVLDSAGLVRGGRMGRQQVWELESKRLEDAQEYLEGISKQWDDALERLRMFVED